MTTEILEILDDEDWDILTKKRIHMLSPLSLSDESETQVNEHFSPVIIYTSESLSE